MRSKLDGILAALDMAYHQMRLCKACRLSRFLQVVNARNLKYPEIDAYEIPGNIVVGFTGTMGAALSLYTP